LVLGTPVYDDCVFLHIHILTQQHQRLSS
jgi:hypothetical protein